MLFLLRLLTRLETFPPGALGPLVTLGPRTVPPLAVRETPPLESESLGDGLLGEDDLEDIVLVLLRAVFFKAAGTGVMVSAGGVCPGAAARIPEDGVSSSSGGGSANLGIGGDASSSGSGGGSLNDGLGGRSSSSGGGSLKVGRGGRSDCVGETMTGATSAVSDVSDGGGEGTEGMAARTAGKGTGALSSGDVTLF